MTITSAKVIKGCISCKNCENICPEIFKVNPTSQVISDKFNENAIKLLMAEKMCPVQVIKVEKEGTYNLENPKATLKTKTYLTPDTLELIFETRDFSFIPGQYVSLQMKDIRGDFSRSYSIASASENEFTLTVKLLRQGRGADFLKKLGKRTFGNFWKKNMQVEYIGGLGDFTLKDTPAKKVMIATGTGLAPMISMLEALPEITKKLLIFGGRYEKDLYYLDKLESFKNLELRICVSRPDDEYTGNKGRVIDYLYKIHPQDEVYICGNPDMVYSVADTLKNNGHKAGKIYHEDFTLAEKPKALWKNILFEGNLPGVDIFSRILIYFGAFIIPLVWITATYFQLTGYEMGGKSLMNHYFDLSWYTVVFVMMIRPLADVFPKIGLFRRLVLWRKGFGIISASIIVTILFTKWYINPFTFTYFFTSPAWALWYPMNLRISEITAMVLLFTSNTFSQKHLGIWWKRIQSLSYVYFISGRIAAGQWMGDDFIYEWMIAVGLFWILAKFKVKLWK